MKKQANDSNSDAIFGEIIYSYTRKQAIEDGVLHDISELAQQAGFKYPVAISEGIVQIIIDAQNKGARDYNGIVWDILNMLRFAIRKTQGTRCDFKCLIWSKYTGKDRLMDLYSTCGPGDDMAPVITIMLPNED